MSDIIKTNEGVRQRAFQLYQEHDKETSSAIDALIAEAATDPDLLSLLVRKGSQTVVNEAVRMLRVDVVNEQIHRKKPHKPRYTKEEQRQVEEGTRKYFTFIDDFPLPGGVPLGKANRCDLQKAASLWEKLADGNAKNARFIRLVEKNTEAGKTVKESLTEEQIQELYKDAMG